MIYLISNVLIKLGKNAPFKRLACMLMDPIEDLRENEWEVDMRTPLAFGLLDNVITPYIFIEH